MARPDGRRCSPTSAYLAMEPEVSRRSYEPVGDTQCGGHNENTNADRNVGGVDGIAGAVSMTRRDISDEDRGGLEPVHRQKPPNSQNG